MAKRGITIARTDFPLYCVQMIGERHVLVAGGGGAAKTGISNAIDIYELKYDSNGTIAHKVNHYETKSRAVMNCSVVRNEKQFYLAVGLAGSCLLHTLRYKVMVPKVENEVLEGLRKRKTNLTVSTNHNTAPKMIGFEIEPGEEVVTDQSIEGGFQKVVRFRPDGKALVTGGADGYFRCWEFPLLKLITEVHSHSNEIDDLDCSPDGQKIVTASKDNRAYVWKFSDGSKIAELNWSKDDTQQYRIRNCRFDRNKDKNGNYALFTTNIPSVKTNKRGSCSCFIIKWDTKAYKPSKVRDCGEEILSAIAISDNGVHLAVGTISGSVSVYISFSLQLIYHLASIHSIFVTGLEFSPTSQEAKTVTGNHDFTLISISADNQVKIHQQQNSVTYNAFWIVIGAALLVFIVFWVNGSMKK